MTEQEIKELQDRLADAEKKQADAERRAAEAADNALRLQQESLSARANTVLSMAVAYKDANGNGHPKALLDWAKNVMSFGQIGEGSGVVKLSNDSKPTVEMQEYMIAAVGQLLSALPGTVPVERLSQDNNDDKGKDTFDYSAEWPK